MRPDDPDPTQGTRGGPGADPSEGTDGPDGTDGTDVWEFRLYVAGMNQRATLALENLRRLLEEHLPGRHRLEVVDLLEEPHAARGYEVLAIPTTVRVEPRPVRKVVGDLSDVERAVRGLELRAASAVAAD